MKIAFIHYHLQTGGVTTVLKSQVSAVRDDCETLVMTGDRAQGTWPCRVVQIPGLGYDVPGLSPPGPEAVADSVLAALHDTWPTGCDLLHIHNPTLAKNRRFLQIIKRLQRRGVNLFLQIHDFAEDGRPQAYFKEPYPADCHYGVINDRDAQMLIRAGLDPSGVHRLPDAVHPLPLAAPCNRQPLVLYPVRAIRRKNLGEAILLSLFLKNGRRLAVTQPPSSDRDRASYRAWKAFVERHDLPVEFEAGQRHDFAALVGAAESMVTTSITEGFGLSFLEPWTAGKLVWGRKLPDISRDFEKNGLRLDHLYERLEVPLDLFDARAFSRRWCDCILQTANAYGLRVDPDAATRAWSDLTERDSIDFGILDERFQRQALERFLSEPAAAERMAVTNPLLQAPGAVNDATTLIEVNRRVIDRHYGLKGYRSRLLSIYRQVIDCPVVHRIDRQALLESFFDLTRFSLLKWCDDDL